MLKVSLEVTSLVNPLAEAWRQALVIAGYDVAGVVRGRVSEELPIGWVRSHDAPTNPDILVSWWGLGSLPASPTPSEGRPDRWVLIVDTYPNASRMSTEVREALRYHIGGRHPDSFICYSPQMVQMLRTRRIIRSDATAHVLVQPFPIRMHRDVAHEPPAAQTNTAIFTGRSDHLFSAGRSMGKDALGSWLTSLIEGGLRVTVQDPVEEALRQQLSSRGFRFYQRLTNNEVLRGVLGDIVCQHDVQLAHYRIVNSTIRRRVATGLSSRFALGLTANTPIAVPSAAVGPRRFLEGWGIGGVADDAASLQRLVAKAPTYRAAWRSNHHSWSAEGQAEQLRRALES